jgi:glycogen(starch) synthase
VGGIYSVIKSKAAITTAEYGERYCLIGPLNRHSVRNRKNISSPSPKIPPCNLSYSQSQSLHNYLCTIFSRETALLISHFSEQAAVEVEALDVQDEALKQTLDSMAERGITYVYGRWLIEGAPRVLLFDTKSGYKHLDEWKGDLWSAAMIPCPPGDDEMNEAVVFGYLVAWFLGEVSL